MFNVVAHALDAEAAQDPDKSYQMAARMSVQYNEFKMKLNDGGKKLKLWPTLNKLKVRTKVRCV